MAICHTCSSEFEVRSSTHRFCSDRCRHASPDAKEKRKADNLARRTKQLEFIRAYKLKEGCSECGYNAHHSALTFDHIVPEDKSFEMAKAHMRSMKQTLTEIAKCRVLCANCHNVHTYNQTEERRNAKFT